MTRRRWLIPVLLTFTALAITGCGDSGDSNGSTVREKVVPGVTGKPAPKSAAAPTTAAAPPPQQKSGGWTGVNADNYRLAKALCRAYPKEEIAHQFKLPPSANEFTIAEKFAAALFSPDFQAPVIDGCLAGFGGG
jgi:hypothetical protein